MAYMNQLDFVDLLDSNGNLVSQIDQRINPATGNKYYFNSITHINYIGADDSNLSSNYKIQGSEPPIRDLYFKM